MHGLQQGQVVSCGFHYIKGFKGNNWELKFNPETHIQPVHQIQRKNSSMSQSTEK